MRLSGVTKRYGSVPALWKLSLDVYTGDFIALFGPNGAGKSTLLKLLASLLGPDQGELIFEGGRLARDSVGYVSHQSLLYNELTGLENLAFYARLYDLDDPGKKASEMLARMELTDAGQLPLRHYSRGMKQRLTLGRALLHDPALLLLDEPYTGLDQHGGRLLTETLRGLRQQGRTVLLVTHNIREGLQLCNRVLIQNRGRIVYRAPRDELDEESLEKIYFEKIEQGRARRRIARRRKPR